MTVGSQQRRSIGPATVDELLCACEGTGLFSKMMLTAVGLAIGTDGIEVTLLSYLVPCVAADWGLSDLESGSLTASVFAGELVGAMVLGVVSDLFGRRLAFQLATILVVVFGMLTAFAQGFWWLLLCRSLVGVGAGGMEVPFDLLGEVVPGKDKDRILVGVQVTWAVGSLFVGVAAWAVLSFDHSWRLLALIAAIPPFAVLCCFTFIPESPRWLMAHGKEKEAKRVLRGIAKRNGVDLADIIILPEDRPGGKEGSILDLWRRPEPRKRCLVASVVWGCFGFLYYGVVLLSASVMGTDDSCSFDYGILFFASSSELVASATTAMYMGLLERKATLSINFVIGAVGTVALTAYDALPWLLVTSFLARGTSYIAACFSWLVTPDLFSTEMRSTGHAVSNSVARIGAIGASYWVASSASDKEQALVLMAAGMLGALAAQAFPSDRDTESHRYDGDGRAGEAETRPLLWDPIPDEPPLVGRTRAQAGSSLTRL